MTKPEKKERQARISIDEHFCKGCGLCVTSCSHHLIRLSEQVSAAGYYPAAFVDPEAKCTGCTLCAKMCPDVAIEVFKTKKKVGGQQ